MFEDIAWGAIWMLISAFVIAAMIALFWFLTGMYRGRSSSKDKVDLKKAEYLAFQKIQGVHGQNRAERTFEPNVQNKSSPEKRTIFHSLVEAVKENEQPAKQP